jgi:hypothetical protein
VNAFLKGIRTDPRTSPYLLPIKAIILNGKTRKHNLVNAVVTFVKDTMRHFGGAIN